MLVAAVLMMRTVSMVSLAIASAEDRIVRRTINMVLSLSSESAIAAPQTLAVSSL